MNSSKNFRYKKGIVRALSIRMQRLLVFLVLLAVIHNGHSLLKWNPAALKNEITLPDPFPVATKKVYLNSDSDISNWKFVDDCKKPLPILEFQKFL